MIKVWTGAVESGLLERAADRVLDRASTFLYLPGASPDRAVSVTMPVRLASWDERFGIAPIFEMNLPEGVLARAPAPRLRQGDRNLRRLRPALHCGPLATWPPPLHRRERAVEEAVPFQSIDEILARRRDGDLFRYLLENSPPSPASAACNPNSWSATKKRPHS